MLRKCNLQSKDTFFDAEPQPLITGAGAETLHTLQKKKSTNTDAELLKKNKMLCT